MQNFNPLVLQAFLKNLQMQQLSNQNNDYDRIAFAPLTPEQQTWANSLPRRDITLQDKNLNYIPTLEQLNKMNILNARGLTTFDREQMKEAREAYNNILRNQQGQ